jgi:hypothetical protein
MQYLMHIHPRWGAGTCVCAREQCTGDGGDIPSLLCIFFECVCYVHHPSLFPYYWIPTTYLYGVGVIVAWCLWLFFFHFFALFKLVQVFILTSIKCPTQKRKCYGMFLSYNALRVWQPPSINHVLSCSTFMCKCCSSFLWGTEICGWICCGWSCALSLHVAWCGWGDIFMFCISNVIFIAF